MHDPGAAFDRLRMVGVDAASDERDLRSQVDVVGSGSCTRSDDRQPMGGVGPHRADHHAGSGGEPVQGFRLAGVGDDQRPVAGLVGQHLPQAVQLLGRPAGQADAESAANQIPSGQLADGTGRAVEHDVEVTLPGVHGR